MHTKLWKVYYCVVCVLCVRVCEIQTRLTQHMSCSPGQVLHFWRAHSPPNPFLMRKLIRKLGRRSHPKDWPHNDESNNPRATQKEIWCYPARHWDVVSPRSLSDKWLRTPHHWSQDCPKGNQSVQCSARHTYRRPLRHSGKSYVNK